MANVRCIVEEASVIGETTGALEPETRFEERYALCIIKIVATMNKGGIPVLVFNPQSKPVRIYKGSTIGKLCPLLGTDQEGKSEDTIPQPCYHICRGERQRKTTTNAKRRNFIYTSTSRENNKEIMN